MQLTYDYLLNELDRGELPQDIAKRFHMTNVEVLKQIEAHGLTSHIIYNKMMSTADRTYLNTLETSWPTPDMLSTSDRTYLDALTTSWPTPRMLESADRTYLDDIKVAWPHPYRAAGYTYISNGASSKTGISHGLSETPSQSNGYIIKVYPDGADACAEMPTAHVTNIGATTFDVELAAGVTVTGNRYFTWVCEKVR